MRVLIQPVITEKSMKQVAKGAYTFRISKNATKTQVKEAVEKAFKITVIRVATTNTKGRTTRIGQKRQEVMLPTFKKALVQVKKGDKIALFEESK